MLNAVLLTPHQALITPFGRKTRGDDPQEGVCTNNDGHVEDRHTSLPSFFSSRVGLRPTLEGTSYVYTVNVTSTLLDIVLFINVSIVMYIMTIK